MGITRLGSVPHGVELGHLYGPSSLARLKMTIPASTASNGVGLPVIIGASAGGGALLIVILGLIAYFYCIRKRKRREPEVTVVNSVSVIKA